MSGILERLINERFQLEGDQEEHTRLRKLRSDAASDIADLLAALINARRSMIVSVTGISDGLTIHDIRRWIEQADAAIAKAEGK